MNFIDPSARIGGGTKVWHFAVILQDVVIGENCSIGSHAEIGRGCIIGDGTRIGKGVFLPPDSIVGDHVFIGPNSVFTDDRYPKAGNRDYVAEPPRICDFAAIGAGAVILPGIVIGSHAMIGAGAIVTRNVPEYGMVRGEPARARLVNPGQCNEGVHG
jgi:acetyltransferase-like isoleucine patch superfamily enzyme